MRWRLETLWLQNQSRGSPVIVFHSNETPEFVWLCGKLQNQKYFYMVGQTNPDCKNPDGQKMEAEMQKIGACFFLIIIIL